MATDRTRPASGPGAWLLQLGCAAALALAAATSSAEDLVGGDAAAGANLYGSSCQSCHGPGGNSLQAANPIIAGQHPSWLQEQITKFRDGERESAVMLPFVKDLTDTDIANLASYLGSQQAGLSGAVDSELVEKGRKLYLAGRPEQGVPSCNGCHGPTGAGIPPTYPRISGQHAQYVVKALTDYRDGKRPSDVMAAIVANLDDDEITALAEYISGLY